MRYIMFLLALLFANVANAIDCQKLPSCEELGYSKEDVKGCAENGYLNCPFDEAYKRCVIKDCAKLGFTESDKTSWCNEIAFCPSNASYTLCKRKAVECKFGDVYYADDTCGSSDNLDSTKTPVGVVFYVTADGRHGRVLAFDEFKGAYSVKDSISAGLSFFGCVQATQGLNDEYPDLFDGQAQTQRVAALDPQSAAAKALNYVPQGIDPNTPYTGKGNWYLPTLGEWRWLYAHKLTCGCISTGCEDNYSNIPIRPVLQKLGKSGIRADRYWSINLSLSTEASYYFGMGYGDINSELLSRNYYIRPIMKF